VSEVKKTLQGINKNISDYC